MSETAMILFVALLLDWFIGDPKWLWINVPHPVVAIGKMISWGDQSFNNAGDTPAIAMRKGAIVISSLILISVIFGMFLNWGLASISPYEWGVEVAIVSIFLAQKSLSDHVEDVALSLKSDGLKRARKAVSLIVGREPEMLNEIGVCRAAIESLAENFCDGVVAPAFWYLVFGLPGLIAYKTINTADSMIAHKNERYLHFGRVTAQIDDLANWLPARLSALLIAVGGAILNGVRGGINTLQVAMRDAGLHRSPNAGWPESAMAGACEIALGGPRIYKQEVVSQAYINASGEHNLNSAHVIRALRVFSLACFVLWGVVILSMLIS